VKAFQPVDVAVVGGGISGLSCAFWAKRMGLSVLLLESEPSVGGCMRSVRNGECIADGGPQSIMSSPEFMELVEAAGIKELARTPAAEANQPYLFHGGRLVPVPQNLPALLSSPLLSLGGKLRLLSEPLVASRRSDAGAAEQDESVAAFVRRRAGPQVLDALVSPFVSGIFAGDPDKLSMRSAFPAVVDMERRHGSVLRGAVASRRAARRNGAVPKRRQSVGFGGGNDRLPAALAEQLGRELRTSAPVQAIWQRGEWLELSLADAALSRIVARSVVLATPAFVAADLLARFEPAASAELRAIAYSPVIQIALAYPRNAIGAPLDGFGFLAARSEGLRILGCVWNSAMFPDRCAREEDVLLTVFLGGALDPGVLAASDDELVRAAHADLRRAMKIHDGMPRVIAGFRWAKAIPQYDVGHDRKLKTIADAVARIPHMHLCGSYLTSPSVPDCIKLAKSVAEGLGRSLETRAKT